ncbi:zinc finger protein ZPR1 [Cimex lectularius]|uniref:Zinc finger ZPR1-type domain-containing protein n=1 Tax=Cimex lectularius TaxID=79782 RepID=A0A8I6SDD9_CIMLE|nr:zinc finger protein ZPR1 [Cimex lectularius]
MSKEKALFRDLNPDDDPETTVIESFCVNCRKNGETRILLTKIPYYKEVIVMSFECENCGYKNNELQSGGQIDEFGVRYTVDVETENDMNRQVVKSDYTCVKIPHINFEIPSQSQKGEITTIEGIINRTIEGLVQDQHLRQIQHPEDAAKIDEFINVLKQLQKVEQPFKLIVEDISGNSFVENRFSPAADPNCKIEKFKRNQEQDNILGIFTSEMIDGSSEKGVLPSSPKESCTLEDLQGEILSFNTNCPECGSPCDTRMKVTQIPYFKEVVIMATTCDVCGHKTNEVKSAGGIEPKGIKIEILVKGEEDFSRDLLKSDTCRMLIPELELEAGAMTLGGKFTTVEGILKDIKDGLEKGGAAFGIFGDSRNSKSDKAISSCISQIEEILLGKKSVTLVLDDPAGNSYVQSLCDEGLDEGLNITHYERSDEQNEELGINDMKTEDYENDQ